MVALAPGGWLQCVALLQGWGEQGRAAALARQVAHVLGDARAVAAAAEATVEAAGALEALAWLLPYAEARPLDASLQGQVLALMLAAGQHAAAEAHFEALRGAHPDSPVAASLFAQSRADLAEARSAYEAAARQFPNDVSIAAGWGEFLLAQAEWSSASRELERAARLSPGQEAVDVEQRALALAASGAVARARRLLEEQSATWAGSPSGLRTYVALAWRDPDPQAGQAAASARVLERAGAERAAVESLLIHASLGRAASREALAALASERDRRLLVATSRLVQDPEGAMAAARTLQPPQVANLYPAQWILLRGEAMRAGDTDLQVRLDDNPPVPAPAARLAREFVGGAAPAASLRALPPEWAAAALLARSRQPGVPADEAWAMRRLATARDPIDALVSGAARSWP